LRVRLFNLVAASLSVRHQGEDERRGAVRIAVAAAVAVMTAVNYAHAATITVKTLDNGTPIVLVTGGFQFGDEVEFRARTASLSNAVVVLQSPGGSAIAGHHPWAGRFVAPVAYLHPAHDRHLIGLLAAGQARPR
jgi:hypothetical protein